MLERESLVTLVNNLAEAVITINKDGIVSIYNAATSSLLDTNANITGNSLDEILSLYDKNAKRISIKSLLKNANRVMVDDQLRTKINDEEIRLEVTYSPIRSAASNTSTTDRNYILILRDITKIKSLEEERDEFISVISHELRTPIAITEGAIDNAKVIFNRDSSNTKAVASTLELAHEQILFLSKMVNDLSTLSRAERGVGDTAS